MKAKARKNKRLKSNKINFYEYIGPCPDSRIVTVKVQNTHWYATKHGWTPLPEMASREEVDKRGLHDCIWLRCEERHAGSAEDFRHQQLIKEACSQKETRKAASKTQSGQRALRGKKLARR